MKSRGVLYVACLIAVAFMVVGCSKSGAAKTPGEVVKAYFKAMEDGDGKTMANCISKDALKKAAEDIRKDPENAKRLGFSEAELKGSDKEIVEKMFAKFGPMVKALAEAFGQELDMNVTIVDEKIEGGKATVKFKGSKGEEQEASFVKEEGAWKIIEVLE